MPAAIYIGHYSAAKWHRPSALYVPAHVEDILCIAASRSRGDCLDGGSSAKTSDKLHLLQSHDRKGLQHTLSRIRTQHITPRLLSALSSQQSYSARQIIRHRPSCSMEQYSRCRLNAPYPPFTAATCCAPPSAIVASMSAPRRILSDVSASTMEPPREGL